MDFLTGTGLAASAGLNAYIPLLTVGLLDRYTQVVNLGPGFSWLSNGWVLIILSVLLLLEVVADKVPVVDTVNDFLQTIVRPTSGGIVFGSSAFTTPVAGLELGGQDTVTDPEAYVSSGAWVPIVLGIVIALVVHLVKMASRPVVNTVTVGAAAPVVSTAEDVSSVVLSLVALLMPVLVVLFVVGFFFFGFWVWKKLRQGGAESSPVV